MSTVIREALRVAADAEWASSRAAWAEGQPYWGKHHAGRAQAFEDALRELDTP